MGRGLGGGGEDSTGSGEEGRRRRFKCAPPPGVATAVRAPHASAGIAWTQILWSDSQLQCCFTGALHWKYRVCPLHQVTAAQHRTQTASIAASPPAAAASACSWLIAVPARSLTAKHSSCSSTRSRSSTPSARSAATRAAFSSASPSLLQGAAGNTDALVGRSWGAGRPCRPPCGQQCQPRRQRGTASRGPGDSSQPCSMLSAEAAAPTSR